MNERCFIARDFCIFVLKKLPVKKRIRFNLLLVLCIYSICIFAQEQDFQPEFRVFEKDLESTRYPKDSLASALVIYESGKSYITQRDYNIITKYKKKVKILKPDGYQYATIKIYLRKGKNKYEKISDIKATSYFKTDGEVEVVELQKDHIFREKVNDSYDAVTFTLPNIKTGSVFTYSYTLDSPYIFNYHEWEFQEAIPKLYSEYKTSIPANYNYNIKLVGLQKLDVNTSELERECFTYGTAKADCAKYFYVMKNIPAFVEEDYMTAKENYLSKIEYELTQVKYFDGRVDNITKGWKDAEREIKLMSLGRELRKSSSVKELLSETVLEEQDLLKKTKKIVEYVQQNYIWNGEYSLFHDVSVKKIIKEKSGNIGSINCLLHNLLKENGIEVYPVLVSTRNNGLPTKLFPVLSEFNYLLVRVMLEGKEYLLDASDAYLSFGQIPFRCLNSYGRQIDFKKGSKWVSLNPKKRSAIYKSLNLKFTSATEVTGFLKTGYTGYHALPKKKEYYPNPESYKRKLEDGTLGFEIIKHTLKSEDIADEKFEELIELKKNFQIEMENGIYLDPFFFKFYSTNPFKLQNRTYPVDFGYKDSYYYTISLDVGEFYQIGALPKSYVLSLPERKAIVNFNTKVLGTKINLIFKLDFKESVYAPVLYEGLKKIMEKAVETQLNSIITLNKIKI